jgi:hypothetical protein
VTGKLDHLANTAEKLMRLKYRLMFHSQTRAPSLIEINLRQLRFAVVFTRVRASY